MVAHTIKYSTWKPESGRYFEFKASLILRSEFQDVQSHIVRPCIIKPKTKNQSKQKPNPNQSKWPKQNNTPSPKI